MKLQSKQAKFVQMIALLIIYAYEQGYQLTFGDCYRDKRCPYGHKKSLHKLRLAVDFNLFKKGKYLTRTKDYKLLGKYWESLGGTWGGRFNDGNHFSLAHQGMK